MRATARVVLCALALAAQAPAFDFTALKPQGYVSDFAQVIDRGSRQHLEQYCARLEKATGVQLALVTIPSLQGEPIEDVANALFRAWGIGSKQSNEGVLLLLAIRDRRSRLEVGYGLEPVIPDGYAGSVLRAMRPALREQRYGEALLVAAAELGERIAQAKGVRLDPPAGAQRAAEAEEDLPPWAFILFLGVVALILLGSFLSGARRVYRRAAASNDLGAVVLGTLMSRPLGARTSGGGFGGFDSGDSFGGFGGGDSGGGGASSSW